MADNILAFTPEELKRRFSGFDELASLLQTMKGQIEQINTENQEAAGRDSAGHKYLQQVKQPMQGLSDVTDGASQLCDAVSKTGGAMADTLGGGEDTAGHIAGSFGGHE